MPSSPLLLGICAGCDKQDRRLVDVGAFDQSLFCFDCVEKFGATELGQVSNAALFVSGKMEF